MHEFSAFVLCLFCYYYFFFGSGIALLCCILSSIIFYLSRKKKPFQTLAAHTNVMREAKRWWSFSKYGIVKLVYEFQMKRMYENDFFDRCSERWCPRTKATATTKTIWVSKCARMKENKLRECRSSGWCQCVSSHCETGLTALRHRCRMQCIWILNVKRSPDT